jgi:hypothetical protein
VLNFLEFTRRFFSTGMGVNYTSSARCFWLVVATGLIVAPLPTSARAQNGTSSVEAPAHKPSQAPSHSKAWSTADEPYIGAGRPQWRYFVEFRARNAASYGHMYVMFGEVNADHEVIKSEIAGLFPAGDARGCENCSIYYWSIGHVLPVPSEIGASDGDLEEQYVLARFRVWVDADQYRRLRAYIRERKAEKGPWNALYANCVIFGRSVASFLDLKMSPIAAIGFRYPQGMVEDLREANGVKRKQLPLRDAAGSLAGESPTKVKHTEPAAENAAAQKAAAAESAAKTAAPSQ